MIQSTTMFNQLRAILKRSRQVEINFNSSSNVTSLLESQLHLKCIIFSRKSTPPQMYHLYSKILNSSYNIHIIDFNITHRICFIISPVLHQKENVNLNFENILYRNIRKITTNSKRTKINVCYGNLRKSTRNYVEMNANEFYVMTKNNCGVFNFLAEKRRFECFFFS